MYLFAGTCAFAAAPVVESITPNTGPTTGGGTAVIRGSNFTSNSTVH
ncbi:MAG: IPT/TIG domain-containing protein, partial [Planctomycetes bacterium]|nr:IPT/TIG domain-containing protein [Planctomycetota bacterium]